MTLIKDGIRWDGRKLEELRPLSAKLKVVENADGSAMFKMGDTIAIASVHGPMEVYPAFLEKADRAILEVNYQMLPFSTDDRMRPGFSRRSVEISSLIKRVFESAIFLEDMPRTKIIVNIDILCADASTRCAAINAASLALATAGIPMKDLVASCAAGKVEDQVVIDVAGKEDTEGEVDLPIAYLPLTEEVLLLQMDGIINRGEFSEMTSKSIEACKQIHDFQKNALMEYRED
ncbi:MAG: exosome complex exonuclease Rrp41 [Candidatus Aenigmarchaeota archaeon]|nr:exosome complex exonuclease Rrp41 [Candidatus Aenigmarchaeota archaeon]